jgi:Arc/MetJ-type ribon-helix-helix transcriptional regulator
MSKSKRKKVGRPKTTGTGAAIVVRMHKPQLTAIDRWISNSGFFFSRPAAIRLLVSYALQQHKPRI